MNTSQADIRRDLSHLEQKRLVEFLESLHRICKIGTYYPAGHIVLDQATAQFERHLGAVANTNRMVLIELKGESLLVENIEILTETNAVREFKKLLLDLGIGAVEVDRTILPDELMQFVRSLLLGRAQLQGTKQFTRADLSDIPPAVRIRQKEFLVDEGSILPAGTGEDAELGLSSVFQALAELGLDRYQIEQCRKFLLSLSEDFSSRPLSVKGLPAIDWTDVRSLLVKVVNTAYRLSDGPGGVFENSDLNALSAIFVGLEREARDKEAKETINLLVSVFGGSNFGRKLGFDGGADKAKGVRPADNIPVLSVGELQSFVSENFVHGKILEKISKVDHCEELAILLQLLEFKQEPAAESRIRQRLRDILISRLHAKEVEILIRGVMHLAACEESSRLHDAVHFLTVLLRSAKNLSSLQFLKMICRKISPTSQFLIWPIIVNELLAVGRAADQKRFAELLRIASGMPGSAMKARWPELEAMDSFQEKKIASDIFDPTDAHNFRLFSFLLETSMKKQIGARILNSLMESPPDWLIEAVAPLLQLAIPQHLKFLQTYLLFGRQREFSVSLKVAAGNIVAHYLPTISEQQKSEAWVAKTILAASEIQVGETLSLLERIIEEKRMVVMPKWPNACRRAATEALKNLKRRSS